jgi:hypothetical protein
MSIFEESECQCNAGCEGFDDTSFDRVTHMIQIQSEALNLFSRKNKDYGDAFATYGTIGVLVRIGDKIQRAIHVQRNSMTLVDESLRDTLLDLHNYAAMALMLMDSAD